MITIHPDQSVSINSGLGIEEFKILTEVSELIISRDKANKFVLPTYGTFTFICQTKHSNTLRGLELTTDSTSNQFPIDEVTRALFKLFFQTDVLKDDIPRVLQITYSYNGPYEVSYWVGAAGIEKSHFATRRLSMLNHVYKLIEDAASEFESSSRDVLVKERVNMEGTFRVDKGGHGNYQLLQKVDNVWQPFNPWPGVGVAGSIPGYKLGVMCTAMYSAYNALENAGYLGIQLFKGIVGIEFDCTAVYRDHRGTHCRVTPRIVLTANLPMELSEEEYGVPYVMEAVI